MGHKPKKRYMRPTEAELWRFNSLGPLRHQFRDDEIARLYTEIHQMAKLARLEKKVGIDK